MNNDKDTEDTSRPFGFWLRAVDRLMAAEFAAAYESFGITRRDWRVMNRLDGAVAGDRHPVPGRKLGRLIERGWVTDADGTWTLTEDGRDAKERLGLIVDGIRAKVTDAVPAEDLATTMATLEQLAHAFGWDETTPLPRGGGRGRRGFGPSGFGPSGFGPSGFGPFGHDVHGAFELDRLEHCHRGGHQFAHGAHAHGGSSHHGGRGHRGHGRERVAQGAYERGFEAGFASARDAR